MIKIKNIMTREIVTVAPDMPVAAICQQLTRHKLSGLPVVDKKGKLIGYVSERDIVAAVKRKDFLSKKARDMMTTRVLTVREDMPAEAAARIFTEKPYRHLPVVRGRRVVGVISRKDVISRLLGQYY